MFILILIILIVISIVSFLWVKGIDYMNENHMDYKGEDFLDEYPPEDKNLNK